MDNNTNETKKEYRKDKRLPIKAAFKYGVLSESKEAAELKETATKNISSSGLLFESDVQMPIDTEIKVILNVPGDIKKVLDLVAKVVRIEKIPFKQNFEIGANFTVITEEQKEEIKNRLERIDITEMLARINKREASDLHLTVNSPPMIRLFGTVSPLDSKALSAEQIKHMIYSMLSEEQKNIFEQEKDLDFSFSPTLDSRYRVSVYKQRGETEVVFRNIMPCIKSVEELGLPNVIEDLCHLRDGLVLIGGTTGSGKSTTIATMIDIINKKRGGVILSLEKPIEFLHKNIKAIVKQREVGIDVSSYAVGLKTALRQDPDVIMVGEITDSDSIEASIAASETGHLVITSLHTTDTVQAFDRIISFFPLEQRNYIYSRLSHSLRAIIIQSLLPHKNGLGRVLATEVCVANTAVKRIINSGDFTQLPLVVQTGSQYKMHTMQTSLDSLFEKNLINADIYENYGNAYKRGK